MVDLVPAETSAPKQAPRLLIVDDNAASRQSIQEMLGGESYEVSSAENASQVMEVLDKQRIDAVLLNLKAVQANPFQVLRRLRSAEGQADAAVILLASSDGME